MKKNLTEIVFILDRSGSMHGLERDTIGGYNSMLANQRTEEGEAVISTVLFDDTSEVIHDRVPIGKISDITEKEYYVRGCTALLDAVGARIGIDNDHSVEFTNDGIGQRVNYEAMSEDISHVRACAKPLDAGWKAKIINDRKHLIQLTKIEWFHAEFRLIVSKLQYTY